MKLEVELANQILHFASGQRLDLYKGYVVRTNVYHKYIKDLKLHITIDLDGFIY